MTTITSAVVHTGLSFANDTLKSSVSWSTNANANTGVDFPPRIADVDETLNALWLQVSGVLGSIEGLTALVLLLLIMTLIALSCMLRGCSGVRRELFQVNG
jgi:hypothetical protein